jgi:predicted flavoprotein YhiN
VIPYQLSGQLVAMKSQRPVHADGAVTATGGGAFVTMSAAKAGVPISAAIATQILTFIIGSLPKADQ